MAFVKPVAHEAIFIRRPLDRRLIRHRHHRLDPIPHLHRPRIPRHHRLPLQMHTLPTLLRFLLLPRILFDSGQKLLSGPRVVHVLRPHVHPLLHVPVADALVDDDADGGFGDVVDDARLAVVHFVRHAFLHGAVDFDVDYVADSVL